MKRLEDGFTIDSLHESIREAKRKALRQRRLKASIDFVFGPSGTPPSLTSLDARRRRLGKFDWEAE